MLIVSQQRQKYTPEYRREAANLVIESQRRIAHVAQEIGLGPFCGLTPGNVRYKRRPTGVFVLLTFLTHDKGTCPCLL